MTNQYRKQENEKRPFWQKNTKLTEGGQKGGQQAGLAKVEARRARMSMRRVTDPGHQRRPN